MGHFNFTEDVNLYKFKSRLHALRYRQQETIHTDLDVLFKKFVIEFIAERKSIAPIPLMIAWGFNSEKAIYNFLNDPEVFLELKNKIAILPARLPSETLLKIKLAYNNALEHQQLTQSHDIAELLALFEIFALIKNLSPEEITIIEQYLPAYAQTYFGGSSLLDFKDDLNKMSPLEFETKHERCFNGMLNNVIKPLIDTEILFSWLEESPQEKENNELTQLMLS